MRLSPALIALMFLCRLPSVTGAAPAAPVPTAAVVPDPEAERASFQVAEGFEVNLFAADPMLAKPIQMNFDVRGRLWVASSSVYPQIKPGEPADDKVLILEDTTGTGRADKVSVFARGLLIPTAVVPAVGGGAYVANSTELDLLTSSKGADTADTREVVLSGFGTEDTHHIVHTLRWGPGGGLYFNQSLYIHSHLETPRGPRRLLAGGVWRLRPDTLELGVFARGLVNTWGLAWDQWGRTFATDGAGLEGVYFLFPGVAITGASHGEKTMHGLNPGSPKYCSLEILSGRHLPDDWQGNLLTNDFRAHRVCRFVAQDDGSGFSAKQLPDLMSSKDDSFRPIDVKMGPDGAVYVADWCNPIINHGEVDFRDPRRDHTHGRIWRVTAKGRPLVQKPRLIDAPTTDLLEQLKSPEGYTRQQAKRVLSARSGTEVAAALAAWVKALDAADPQVEHHRLEALWAYETVNVVEPALLATVLQSRDGRARAAAVRVASHWHDRLSSPLETLAPLATDDDAHVRLEVIRALAEIPSAQSVRIALSALDKPSDRFIDYALDLAVNDLKDEWLPAYETGRFTLADPKQLAFALQAVGSKRGIGNALAQLRSGKASPEARANLLELVANAGDAVDVAAAFDAALDAAAPPVARADLLGAVARAARDRKITPQDRVPRLAPLLSEADASVRAAAMPLAGAWKVAAARPRLVEAASASPAAGDSSPAASDAVRRGAMEALALLNAPEDLATLAGLASTPRPPRVRAEAIGALVTRDPKAAAAKAADLLAMANPDVDPQRLVTAFLQRAGGDSALAAALTGKTLAPDTAKLGLRAVSAAARTDSPLLAALEAAGGDLHPEAKELGKAEMAAVVADVAKIGDPARGEAIFRRKELSCLQCHAVGGAGGQVGPDLISLGASAPLDYIVDSILVPNKAVKEGFAATVVTTWGGDIFTGIKVGQTNDALVLRDAAGDKIVPIPSIKDQKPAGSIMPAGLADGLTHGEFLDLLRFLSELGRPGPYSIGRAPVARRWEALDPVPADVAALAGDPAKLAAALKPLSAAAPSSGNPAAATASWSPVYSEVNGSLPRAALPDGSQLAILRCRLDVTTGGPMRLRVVPPSGVTLLLDGTELPMPHGQVAFDAKPGVRTLTLVVDGSARKEAVRCELLETPASPARAQFVGGK